MMVTSIQNPPQQTPLTLGGTGVISPQWFSWLTQLAATINSAMLQLSGLAGGYTGTVVTAKLTTGGAEGSMTFKNGILTAQTPAT